jgi:uncharacterized RDD family membrane protein YckC
VTEIAPGWYKDPADPTTQRYWDGEGWIGAAIPADATPPAGPPPPEPVTAPPAPVPVPAPVSEPSEPTPVPGTPWGLNRTASPPSPGGPVPAAPPFGLPPQYVGVAQPRPHGLTLAHVGTRFVARMVDALALFVLCAVANAWFAIQFWQAFGPYWSELWRRAAAGDTSTTGMPALSDSAGTLLLAMCIAVTAVWFAYEVPATANSGQTLGKRLLGIKVVRLESAEPLGFGRSLRRWSRLGLPTLLWYCCGVGLLLQLIDCLFAAIDRPLHQAVHDKTAGTVVVQVPRPAQLPGGSRVDPS